MVTKQGQFVGYTLITRTGKVYTFYVQAVAELYQQIQGGVVITQQIFEQETVAQ